jgi:hypothetical protein
LRKPRVPDKQQESGLRKISEFTTSKKAIKIALITKRVGAHWQGDCRQQDKINLGGNLMWRYIADKHASKVWPSWQLYDISRICTVSK